MAGFFYENKYKISTKSFGSSIESCIFVIESLTKPKIMNVTATPSEPHFANGSTYLTFNCACGTKEASVMFVYGEFFNYMNVHYKNAMSRAYRGHGIRFENVEEAYAHYRDAEILAMIDAADFEYRNHRAETETV